MHVRDAAHAAVYPRIRSYEAELYHQVNPREMDETFWLLFMNNRDWVDASGKLLAPLAQALETFGQLLVNPYTTLSEIFDALSKFNFGEMMEAIRSKPVPRKWNSIDTAFLMHELSHVHFVVLWYYRVFREHLKTVEDDYNVELIVNEIYNSITPAAEGKRTIKWSAVKKWIGDKEGLTETVKIGESSFPTLTKEGVRLLLLDMSILAPKSK